MVDESPRKIQNEPGTIDAKSKRSFGVILVGELVLDEGMELLLLWTGIVVATTGSSITSI